MLLRISGTVGRSSCSGSDSMSRHKRKRISPYAACLGDRKSSSYRFQSHAMSKEKRRRQGMLNGGDDMLGIENRRELIVAKNGLTEIREVQIRVIVYFFDVRNG